MIESSVKKAVLNERKFPKLMRNVTGEHELIVLFSERAMGIVVSDTSNKYCTGYHSNDWCTIAFEDFCGEIILKNT
jgi:hypothetical protein